MSASEATILPASLFLDTDRSSPVPVYYQIAQQLEKAIKSGELTAGARLENEISLAERLGLSRPTIRRALQELVNKGLLVRRRGIGTQVVHGSITRTMALTSLHEDLDRAGQRPSQRVLQHDLVTPSAEVREQLGVDDEAKVLRVRRLRFADGIPLALLENFVPAPFSDLSQEVLGEHSLYKLLQARGVSISVARQQIGARRATEEEAQLLEVDRGGPLISMSRTAFDNSGRAVEYGAHVYRPDLYSFDVTLVSR